MECYKNVCCLPYSQHLTWAWSELTQGTSCQLPLHSHFVYNRLSHSLLYYFLMLPKTTYNCNPSLSYLFRRWLEGSNRPCPRLLSSWTSRFRVWVPVLWITHHALKNFWDLLPAMTSATRMHMSLFLLFLYIKNHTQAVAMIFADILNTEHTNWHPAETYAILSDDLKWNYDKIKVT